MIPRLSPPRRLLTVCFCLSAISLLRLAGAAEFPAIFNTETSTTRPLPPADALAAMRLPPGFKATVFAAEPDVQQPIAMTTDSRGRLWVAENYTYAERDVAFETRLRDRIVIFEDTDNDGRFDKRTVFWDGAQRLTSIEWEPGGVWALCAPNLVFIPDRNGDDRPDSEPVVVLDGWDARAVRHNIVNGLRWGPDGWLYGRHGILANSLVGPPGTPSESRTRLNCSIWRYHPVRKAFEVVAVGTTNPWGMDWDEHGQPFFINTVIGHLWHVFPGAHYRRMYGDDANPFVYSLMEQHADHFHWDTRETWSDVRKLGVTPTSSEAGGGHAHSGLLIYQGGNWPAQFRNRALTVNLHGHRLNMDRLDRSGSGFVGRHEPDPVFFGDPWFRGVELIAGPDGGVFVADWSDTGECHEQDGVHRTSGRIFKIVHGTPGRPPSDPATLSSDALVDNQSSDNEWVVRMSRLILRNRAMAGNDLRPIASRLKVLFSSQTKDACRLRALWALQAIGAADGAWMLDALHDPSEFVRSWSIQLLAEQGNPSPKILQEFRRLAAQDPSALVRLHLASTLQRLPHPDRAALALPLLAHAEDAADHNLPLLLWYGIEPMAGHAPDAFASLADTCAIPTVRRFIARRVAEELTRFQAPASHLIRLAATTTDDALRLDILDGLADGLAGVRKVQMPAGWPELQSNLAANTNRLVRERILDLAALFGDGRALESIRQVVFDPKADMTLRRKALQSLVDSRPADLADVCLRFLSTRDLCVIAARGLVAIDPPGAPEALIKAFPSMYGIERQSVITAMVTRPSFARALLEAMARRRMARADLSATHARQIRSHGDADLNRRLAETWGVIREANDQKRLWIAETRSRLTPAVLAGADRAKGRVLFNQICAPCHMLYGEGGRIGPDLTGAGRDSLDYLLENIADPGAVVAADFRMSVVTLKDGRVLNGVVVARTDARLTLQTATDRQNLERSDVAQVVESEQSLMPDGLADGLTPGQLTDLVAYLQSKSQVDLPRP